MICLSFDVEWAHPDVLADLVGLLDQHGLKGTFFCTHAGISVPGHERAIHPNFRWQGDTAKKFIAHTGKGLEAADEKDYYAFVVKETLSFAPESRGVRAHSLHHDTLLLQAYASAGLRYDSSYLMPLNSGLKPILLGSGFFELPIYYNDFHDLRTGMTRFSIEKIPLEAPGLKVFNFHPNTLYLNASSLSDYENTRADYASPTALLAARNSGAGLRTLFLDLLKKIREQSLATATLGQVLDQHAKA